VGALSCRPRRAQFPGTGRKSNSPILFKFAEMPSLLRLRTTQKKFRVESLMIGLGDGGFMPLSATVKLALTKPVYAERTCTTWPAAGLSQEQLEQALKSRRFASQYPSMA
jgi:hypothetical protein